MSRRRPRHPAGRRAYGYPYGHGHGYAQGYGAVGASYGAGAIRYGHRDRRRERRMRRRHGRGGPGLPMFAFGSLVALAILARAIGFVVAGAFATAGWGLLVALLAVAAVSASWGVRRAIRHRAPAVPQPAPVSGRDEWAAAKTDFERVRGEYAAHECDPMSVLRLPALSDVSVPSTARFVDAFAEAQALDTDRHPGAPHDAGYVAAVDRAVRAWAAARDAADRIRLTGLAPEERSSVERVLKLLTTARDSDSEPERLAAYARARSELDRLDRAGVVHLPRTARAAIDAAARGALPG